MRSDESRRLFAEATAVLPGGVDSPVRAFGAVGGQPRFINRGYGSKIYDVDGNEYVDYVCSWGPLILGHAAPRVTAAIKEAVDRGTSYGAPTEQESILATMVIEAVPSVEMVRFVNSGTEAAMSALRLARAFTGRDLIVKFDGCYHGHADMLLVEAGSGVATLGLPNCPGVPSGATKDTLTAPYNDLSAVRALFDAHPGKIAAVIVEPVAGNMGVVLPKDGFLEGLRQMTKTNGALLVFDEVITGFRVAYGGAQQRFNINPDLTVLGKIIGGGLPVGAYAGKKDIMQIVAPTGSVYQAGTLSGNPLAMTAGIATLSVLKEPGVYEQLEATAQRLTDGVRDAALAAQLPIYQTRVGAMFCTFFAEAPVTDYQTAKAADAAKFAVYFTEMLEKGVYIAPSQFESGFVSLAHTEEDIDLTLDAYGKAFAAVRMM